MTVNTDSKHLGVMEMIMQQGSRKQFMMLT